ncbi:hypothetical protein J7J00_17850 [Bacillus sp. ISL-4]|uniref:hypothetical protein n=1 Tax=Bacillus sp. ISL-4 TaxID=2819125 RepID=UPI001BEC20EB|nr:hypothetical protein [Bacillus sp. ISL-4]MBT2667344.1 hypothetical protein [Bacillus sp. ISL-4]
MKKERQRRFFQKHKNEIRDSILSELVFNIFTLIPRIIIRLVKSLFYLIESEVLLNELTGALLHYQELISSSFSYATIGAE